MNVIFRHMKDILADEMDEIQIQNRSLHEHVERFIFVQDRLESAVAGLFCSIIDLKTEYMDQVNELNELEVIVRRFII
jgi:hypothetical protein